MNVPFPPRRAVSLAAVCLGLLLSAFAMGPIGPAAMAQDAPAAQSEPRPSGSGTADQPGPQPFAGGDEAARRAEADLADPSRESKDAPAAAPAKHEEPRIDMLNLMFRGGVLMWPIGAMSLLVVTFGLERFLGLRRSKVIPSDLVAGLGRLAAAPGGLDPRRAYQLCRQYPSTAANVLRTMLLKVGRPHAELEHAVAEANQREAARLYANVRWLNLAAGVAPLLGLLGTVQGMIMAFFVTANLPTGANRTEMLAEGIYTALVTTFAGLSVAIPAAVLAHFLEGRIQTLFRELDEVLLGLMPQLERFEGRLRVSTEHAEGPTYHRVDGTAPPRAPVAATLVPDAAPARPSKSDHPSPK